jgi:predicted HD phosphohydrolase
MSPAAHPARTVADVLALLRLDGSGPSPDGQEAAAHGASPPFTGLDHGLQCAANLRVERPDDIELQVAGLVHDLGHRLVPGAPERHGSVGASWLAPLVGPRVAALVELHVDAKRYLVTVDPEYRGQLSAGSARTLVAQGEAMTTEEVADFEGREHAADAVALRRSDEAAKVPGLQVPGLDAWVPALEALARAPRDRP